MSKNTNKAKNALDNALERDIVDIREGARNKLAKPGREYLDALINPRTAKLCGVPTRVDGPTRTKKLRTTAKVTVVSGSTSGYGFITIGRPVLVGPYTDRLGGFATTNSSANLSSVPDGTGTGVTAWNWGDAEYTSAGSAARDVHFRLVGLSATIFNRTAMLEMGGEITILEEPNHYSLAGIDYDQVSSYPRARTTDGKVSGRDHLVLNLHPTKSGELIAGYPEDPLNFHTLTGANTTGGVYPVGVIAFSSLATNPQQLKVQIDAIWEVRGKKIRGGTVTPADSRGMDLVFNTMALKRLSGYHGSVYHAQTGYLASAWHWAKKLGTNLISNAKASKEIKGKYPALSAALDLAGMAL